jgi:hypothetical protein
MKSKKRLRNRDSELTAKAILESNRRLRLLSFVNFRKTKKNTITGYKWLLSLLKTAQSRMGPAAVKTGLLQYLWEQRYNGTITKRRHAYLKQKVYLTYRLRNRQAFWSLRNAIVFKLEGTVKFKGKSNSSRARARLRSRGAENPAAPEALLS